MECKCKRANLLNWKIIQVFRIVVKALSCSSRNLGSVPGSPGGFLSHLKKPLHFSRWNPGPQTEVGPGFHPVSLFPICKMEITLPFSHLLSLSIWLLTVWGRNCLLLCACYPLSATCCQSVVPAVIIAALLLFLWHLRKIGLYWSISAFGLIMPLPWSCPAFSWFSTLTLPAHGSFTDYDSMNNSLGC